MRAAPGVEPCTFDLEERAAEEQSVRFLDIKVWICGGSLNVSNWCKPEPDFGALVAFRHLCARCVDVTVATSLLTG